MIGLHGDDIRSIFNIVCTLLGIGSLSMGFVYAQSGPIFGTIALISMCLINIYSTVLLVKCFLVAPIEVETYSDLGYYIGGKQGRFAVQLTQLGTSILIPVAFMVISGNLLLPAIFKDAIYVSNSVWIIITAMALWPVCLIKTLKEAYIVMILGAMTAFFADFVAVFNSAFTKTWEGFAATEVAANNVVQVFGALSLSFGAGLITPTILREHPNPSNMTKIIIASLGIITLIYTVIAFMTWFQYGCSAPQNLLVSMQQGEAKKIAYLLMQIHVIIAFAVILNPALYYIERCLLDKSLPSSVDKNKLIDGQQPSTPVELEVAADSKGLGRRLKSILLRTAIIAIQTFCAILGQGSFTDIADFIGATTISSCCIILPCIFYLKHFYKSMSTLQLVLCLAVIFVSTVLSIYTAYVKLMNVIETASQFQLFQSKKEEQKETAFPYCPAEYKESMKSKGIYL